MGAGMGRIGEPVFRAMRMYDQDPQVHQFLEGLGRAIAHPQYAQHPGYEQFRQQMWQTAQQFLTQFRQAQAQPAQPPQGPPVA
jgi:hypothetical protein